jgi:hypothetical protein
MNKNTEGKNQMLEVKSSNKNLSFINLNELN